MAEPGIHPAPHDPPTIRAARPTDLAALILLERAAFGDDAAPGWCLRQWIDLGSSLCAIAVSGSAARSGGGAVGVVGAVYAAISSDVADRAWILSIAVDPSHRGRGIADALLAAAEAETRRRGVRALMATVSPANAASRRLFARRGYRESEPVPGYFGPGEDRIILTLTRLS